MKKILKLAAMAALVLSFASCESFLDTTNYWSKDSSNFPVNATDAEQMLAGIYNNLNVAIGTNVHVNHFLWSVAASDDALGGGGQNDQTMQAEDLLLNFGTDMYNDFYVNRYKGIARANAAIEAMPSRRSAVKPSGARSSKTARSLPTSCLPNSPAATATWTSTARKPSWAAPTCSLPASTV